MKILSDEEIEKLFDANSVYLDERLEICAVDKEFMPDFARAIEAAVVSRLRKTSHDVLNVSRYIGFDKDHAKRAFDALFDERAWDEKAVG